MAPPSAFTEERRLQSPGETRTASGISRSQVPGLAGQFPGDDSCEQEFAGT